MFNFSVNNYHVLEFVLKEPILKSVSSLSLKRSVGLLYSKTYNVKKSPKTLWFQGKTSVIHLFCFGFCMTLSYSASKPPHIIPPTGLFSPQKHMNAVPFSNRVQCTVSCESALKPTLFAML
jgi:hypothetical protein